MLDDRPYMREPVSGSRWSATTWLLVSLGAAFVVQSLLEFYGLFDVPRYFYLSVGGLQEGFVWQLFTFQFLHGGALHLFCNALAIYFFGRDLEANLGPKAFLQIYFGGGLAGGLLQMLVAWLVPQYFGGPVVGASAGAFALVAAFATLGPERSITLLVFFVLPVTLKAKLFLWISLGLAIFGLLVPKSPVAHAAHLGGILVGLAYIHWGLYARPWPFQWRPRRPAARPRELVKASSGRRAAWRDGRSVAVDNVPPGEFISREVDPILDKISAHGIQSLTERERKVLEAARSRMAKR
jgi:membrane associated rhomboid family serine protease